MAPWVNMSGFSPVASPVCNPSVKAILVVDDDVLIRLCIADHLRESGFNVSEAGDAEAAIAMLKAAPFDLVFSDVQMPGPLDGFDVARWVEANRPHVGVILASGVVRADTAAMRLADGQCFLQKPYRQEQVTEQIKALFGARTPEPKAA